MNTPQQAPSNTQSFKVALIVGVVLLALALPCVGAFAVAGIVLLRYRAPVPPQLVAPPQKAPNATAPTPDSPTP
jgi:hypothetical protein